MMLYIIATPMCLFITISVWMFCRIAKLMRGKKPQLKIATHLRKTALITGAASTKALHVCRALGKAGHRIILADCKKFKYDGTQYSKYVSKFYCLPNIQKGEQGNIDYVSALLDVAKSEDIDWFIPIGSTVQTDSNTLAAEMIAQFKPNVQCFTLKNRALASVLDNKLSFAKECQNLGLSTPQFFRIDSADELLKLREKGLFKRKHFFLKTLESLSPDRENFDRIPHDINEFEEYMKYNREKVAPDTPYYVCEFVKGKEYASNAICREGIIYAIHVCPSSPMQIDYSAVEKKEIKEWTIEFCKKKKITGFVCFDFIESQQTGEIYCIECNPRLHSSVVSYLYGSELEGAIRDALEADVNANTLTKINPISPSCATPKVYWLYNEAAKVLQANQSVLSFLTVLLKGYDAVYDTDDPLPFFVANTVQMINLLWQVFNSAEHWKAVDPCIGWPH